MSDKGATLWGASLRASLDEMLAALLLWRFMCDQADELNEGARDARPARAAASSRIGSE